MLSRYEKYKNSLRAIRILLRQGYGEIEHFICNSVNGGLAIYNSKSRNVIAFKNKSGVVFVRRNSIYSRALASGNRKVVLDDNMKRIKFSPTENNINYSLLVSRIADELAERGDKAGVFTSKHGGHILNYRNIRSDIETTLKNRKNSIPNTMKSLKNIQYDQSEITINITDTVNKEEDIVQKFRHKAAVYVYHNIEDIVANSVMTVMGSFSILVELPFENDKSIQFTLGVGDLCRNGGLGDLSKITVSKIKKYLNYTGVVNKAVKKQEFKQQFTHVDYANWVFDSLL